MSLRWPWAGRPFPWTGTMVILGLGLRLYHYLRNPSMWHDEAALVLNVIGKDFGELLGPLLFAEAAPPLFLWIERLVALTLGEGTYALRLIPFLASCSALILVVPVARRVLLPVAVPWAVLLFACSDHLLWHACEAKPYALDVLVAVALFGLFSALRSWPLARQLTLYSALAPLAIILVYPGCFLFGGLLLTLLPSVWRTKEARTGLSYGLLMLTVVGTFGLLLAGPVRAQRCDMIVACWRNAFPPWQRPWALPSWTLLQTLEIFRYCCEPAGAALAVLALAGGVGLWRRGQRSLVAFLVVPVLLAYVASWGKAYPYGGTRVLVYAAPAIVLLIAESVPPLLAWLQPRTRLGTAAFVLFLLLPFGFALYRVAVHWPRADCAGAAAYVLAHRLPGDAVTVNCWEGLYYFRHPGPALHSVEELAGPSAARLWLVIGDRDPNERLRLAQKFMPTAYRTLEWRDFSRTTVLLVARGTPE